MTEPVTGLALLRTPFPPHQISKLPKPSKAQTDAVKADFKKGVRCKVCAAWHHPDVVHLDYVGHAALTDRLLDADPSWAWEPAALRDGLPAFDQSGGLWIRLTVCGVTRLGYGHAAAKPGVDPGAREKEVIGDALRNAAMRFGAALDLWHKGDLHGDDDEQPEQRREQPRQEAPRHDPPTPATLSDDQRDMMMTMLEKTGADVRAFCQHFGIASVPMLPAARFDEAFGMLDRKAKKAAGRRAEPAAVGNSDVLDDEVPY